MNNKSLPERQLEVMQVLWNSGKAMTASEVMTETGMAINSVQACLRGLSKKGYIKQDDIVYSGTVLARNYVPAVSMEEYLKISIDGLMSADTRKLVMDVFAREISSIEVLEELEQMIRKRRKELEENDRK